MANSRHLITDNLAFVRLILDNACPLTEQPGGIKVFYIESHCVAWRIEAVKEDGEWNVLAMTASDC